MASGAKCRESSSELKTGVAIGLGRRAKAAPGRARAVGRERLECCRLRHIWQGGHGGSVLPRI